MLGCLNVFFFPVSFTGEIQRYYLQVYKVICEVTMPTLAQAPPKPSPSPGITPLKPLQFQQWGFGAHAKSDWTLPFGEA